jgi:hypothetical protein
VELNVFGGGFLPGARVEIGGEGILVHSVEFINAEHLLAFVEVRDEAPLGWRPVIVSNPDEQTGGRERALKVVDGRETPPGPPPPPPPPPPDGVPPWVWPGVAVLLGGLGVTIGRALALRTRLTWERMAQLQWQLEATKELPESKEACTWACKAEARADLLARWNVTALQLTPLLLPSGKSLPAKRLEGATLAPLNEAARIRHVLEDEPQTRRRIAPIVDVLLEQILAWKAEGQTPAFTWQATSNADSNCATARRRTRGWTGWKG